MYGLVCGLQNIPLHGIVMKWQNGKLPATSEVMRLARLFHCCSVGEMMKDYKKVNLIMWTNYKHLGKSVLGQYFKASSDVRLPWQQVSSTKWTSEFQFLQIV